MLNEWRARLEKTIENNERSERVYIKYDLASLEELSFIANSGGLGDKGALLTAVNRLDIPSFTTLCNRITKCLQQLPDTSEIRRYHSQDTPDFIAVWDVDDVEITLRNNDATGCRIIKPRVPAVVALGGKAEEMVEVSNECYENIGSIADPHICESETSSWAGQRNK